MPVCHFYLVDGMSMPPPETLLLNRDLQRFDETNWARNLGYPAFLLTTSLQLWLHGDLDFPANCIQVKNVYPRSPSTCLARKVFGVPLIRRRERGLETSRCPEIVFSMENNK